METAALNVPFLSVNLLLLKDLEEIVRAFDAEGLGCLALKGAVFSQFLYARPDRPMEDIDLLVRPEDGQRARELLARLGFAPVAGTVTDLKRGRTTIDLETHVWYLDTAGLERLWSRAVTLSDGGRRLRAPSWEDHFVFLIAHNAVHHACWDETHREDLRLLSALSLDWNEAARELKLRRLEAAALASFRLTGVEPPELLRRELCRAAPTRIEAAAYKWILNYAALSGVGHALRLWTAPDRTRALWRFLFPDQGFLRRRYATSFPGLYRLLRPFLLLAAGAGALIGAPRSRAGGPRPKKAAGFPAPAANRRR